MPTSLQAKLVKCPFYMNDDRNCISCEGPVDDSRLRVSFIYPSGGAFPKKKAAYLHDLCCKNYKDCRVYQMLMRKYDE